jgi:hypothetical protein
MFPFMLRTIVCVAIVFATSAFAESPVLRTVRDAFGNGALDQITGIVVVSMADHSCSSCESELIHVWDSLFIRSQHQLAVVGLFVSPRQGAWKAYRAASHLSFPVLHDSTGELSAALALETGQMLIAQPNGDVTLIRHIGVLDSFLAGFDLIHPAHGYALLQEALRYAAASTHNCSSIRVDSIMSVPIRLRVADNIRAPLCAYSKSQCKYALLDGASGTVVTLSSNGEELGRDSSLSRCEPYWLGSFGISWYGLGRVQHVIASDTAVGVDSTGMPDTVIRVSVDGQTAAVTFGTSAPSRIYTANPLRGFELSSSVALSTTGDTMYAMLQPTGSPLYAHNVLGYASSDEYWSAVNTSKHYLNYRDTVHPLGRWIRGIEDRHFGNSDRSTQEVALSPLRQALHGEYHLQIVRDELWALSVYGGRIHRFTFDLQELPTIIIAASSFRRYGASSDLRYAAYYAPLIYGEDNNVYVILRDPHLKRQFLTCVRDNGMLALSEVEVPYTHALVRCDSEGRLYFFSEVGGLHFVVGHPAEFGGD